MSTRPSCIHLVLLVVLSLSLVSGIANAQAVSGDLTGNVFDTTGASIPGATVVASNDETGVKTTIQTNAAGVYRFTNLPIGRYTLTASAGGFSTDTLKNVDVTLNTVVTANMTLSVGSVHDGRSERQRRRY